MAGSPSIWICADTSVYADGNQIKLGLDLAGGVSITYQAKEENPSSEDMADTIYKLQLDLIHRRIAEIAEYADGNQKEQHPQEAFSFFILHSSLSLFSTRQSRLQEQLLS